MPRDFPLENLVAIDIRSSNFQRGTRLVEVHESIAEVKGILLLLNLKDCKSPRKLPRDIDMLNVLETLIISGGSNLEELPTDLRGCNL